MVDSYRGRSGDTAEKFSTTTDLGATELVDTLHEGAQSNKVVVACLTAEDLSTVQQLANSAKTQVIAVALDLGSGVGLRALRESALVAGAVRCHAIDVRESFARDCVLPAIAAETFQDSSNELQARAREFVTMHLVAIAALEGEAMVAPPSYALVTPAARTYSTALDQAAHVSIAFERGVPCSVNEIVMSMVEVLDSLGAIAAAHGIDGADAALRALHAAHRRLRAGDPQLTGSAELEISRAGIRAALPELATA
jgi:argininosuccinate synthase